MVYPGGMPPGVLLVGIGMVRVTGVVGHGSTMTVSVWPLYTVVNDDAVGYITVVV